MSESDQSTNTKPISANSNVTADTELPDGISEVSHGVLFLIVLVK